MSGISHVFVNQKTHCFAPLLFAGGLPQGSKHHASEAAGEIKEGLKAGLQAAASTLQQDRGDLHRYASQARSALRQRQFGQLLYHSAEYLNLGADVVWQGLKGTIMGIKGEHLYSALL